MADQTVARTIMQQIGRSSLMAVGAHAFAADESSVRFKVGGGHRRYVTVKLDASDTYTVTFARIKRGAYEWVEMRKVENAYCEDLSSLVYDMVHGRGA